MKQWTVVVTLCAALAGCVQPEHGLLRPKPAPQGVESRDPCGKLKQLASINPIYPREAIPVKQDGWVLLQYDVSASGVPFNLAVLDSSPQGVFDQASLAALSQWRYGRRSFPTNDCLHIDNYSVK